MPTADGGDGRIPVRALETVADALHGMRLRIWTAGADTQSPFQLGGRRVKSISIGLASRVAMALAALILSTRGALDVRVYDEARNDRFYTGADPDPFLRGAADWSGVGQSGGTWGTMVSPSFYLTANHYHAGGGFLSLYDDMGVRHDYAIAGGQRVLDSDLWLGRLAAPIPQADHIASYSVSADLSSGFIGEEVWAFGQDAPPGIGAQRIGRNVVDGVGTEVDLFGSGGTSEQLMVFNYQSAAQSAVGGDEMRFVDGDSGGPTFAMASGDTPVLVGINYFIYDAGDRRDPSQLGYAGSGVTRVSAYIAAIGAAMAAQGSSERLTVVPEPSMVVLLTAAGVCLAAWRPKRRATRSAA
jgi:hypothetical protein